MSDAPDRALFIIFGGTGDLLKRKLMPALARQFQGELARGFHVLGVARSKDYDDESFRKLTRESLAAAKVPEERIREFSNFVHYQTIDGGKPEDFRTLAARIESIEQSSKLPPNRAFYLALPTGALASVTSGLGSVGLNKSRGWTRLVVEKPFGTDLKSATELGDVLHKHFDEKQIYRIDHYLGKDTVQNLLVLRFANPVFESLWNRERVQCVTITVAESLGVEQRAGYYDKSGALRDMIQNHLTQLLTLVAMEVPAAFEASAIRYEKVKVLRSIEPITAKDAVYGQYTAGVVDGQKMRGYQEEPSINPGSRTETFVGIEAKVDTWRWQGVPFYLRTGKRLKRRITQIAVRFRSAPISLFRDMGAPMDSPDVLLITLQPDEGVALHFDVKVPGQPFRLRRIPLEFHYKQLAQEMPEAYETLLADVLAGDQTLFVHGDEVLESWRIYAPLLERPPAVHPYAAGSWGPSESECMGLFEDEL